MPSPRPGLFEGCSFCIRLKEMPHLTGSYSILPLAALLASSASDLELFLELLRDEGPPLGPIFVDELHNGLIFL